MNNLQLLTKIEEFIYKIYPMLINFPKAEKYSLCSEIKENLYELHQLISRANYVKSKRLYYAQEAEGRLETLKFLVKLCRQRKYISLGAFKELDLDLTEISKMLTGYIKTTIGK